MNSRSLDTWATLGPFLLLPGRVWVVCLSNKHRICVGHKAQTTHWEVLELLKIWFSLCRKRKESPHLCVEPGITALCCSHIFFEGKTSDSLHYPQSTMLLPPLQPEGAA